MPTLRPRGSMIAGRVGPRRVRRLRWSTERAKEKIERWHWYKPEQSASYFTNHGRRVQEDRGMQSVVGIALLVVGVVLIIFGMQASASLGSRLSELFTGTPSDRTIWLLILGVVAAIVGLGLLLVGRRSTL